MSTIKQCTHCNRVLNIDQFYMNGKDNYCKSCRKAFNHKNYQKRKTVPKHLRMELSTQKGLQLLHENKIPAVPGIFSGHHWADLFAWAIVPIKVKYATPGTSIYNRGETGEKFHWQFTHKQQATQWDGVFLFIAEFGKTIVPFIVPSSEAWFIDDNNLLTITALTVVFSNSHTNSRNYKLLLPYKNRWDLINTERDRRASEL